MLSLLLLCLGLESGLAEPVAHTVLIWGQREQFLEALFVVVGAGGTWVSVSGEMDM